MALARFIVSPFGRWLSRGCRWLERRSSPRPPLDPRHALGRRGEDLAARWLRRHGYKVLYRNYRARGGGEVDIVARHGETLAFIEVKTRSGTAFGRPGEAVGAEKQRLIAKGAQSWLKLLGNPDILFRFDIVEVVVDEQGTPACEIIENAFTIPEPYRYPARRGYE